MWRMGRRLAVLVLLASSLVFFAGRGKKERVSQGASAAIPLLLFSSLGTSEWVSVAARPPRWLAQEGAPDRAVSGRVTADGVPVAGVRVTLSSVATRAGLFDAPSRVTDGQGSFDFGLQMAGLWEVAAEAPGYAAALEELNLADPTLRPDPAELELYLGRCDRTLSGSVYDSSGGMVAGALISLRGSPEMQGVSVTSDDEGRYSLCVPRARGTVEASAEGYGTVKVPWVVAWGSGEPSTHDFFLTPAATVVGQVVTQDGQPVAGAVVTAHAGDVIHLGSSDALGQFRIPEVQGGRVWLEARADGLRTLSQPSVAVDAGDTTELIVIHMASALAVRGRVVAGGRDMGGVVVFAGGTGERHDAVTQPSGEFTIAGLGPGVVRVGLADQQESEELELQLLDRDIGGIVIEMQHTGRIRGRVTRGGQPVPWASIDADSDEDRETGRTDARGEYEVVGLAPGEYNVTAELPGGAEVAVTTVTIGDGERRDHVDLQLEPDETAPSATLSGIVVDEHGTGVPGVRVEAQREEPFDRQEGLTAGNGTFVIEELEGGGDYEIRVSYDGFPDSPELGGQLFVPVAPREHREGFRIVVRHLIRTVSGIVVTGGGDPVPDARVVLESLSPTRGCFAGGFRWRPGAPVFTDVDGKFSFSVVPPGTYRVAARSGAGMQGLVADVEAGAAQVIVRLEGTGRIEGVVEGFAELPTIRALEETERAGYDLFGRIVSPGPSQPAGLAPGARAFVIDGLAPGRYLVRAHTAQEAAEEEVVVTAGGTHFLRLQSGGTASVAGRAVEEGSGRPMAEVRCRGLSGERHEITSVALSDAGGTFSLSPLAAGSSVVACTVERHGRSWDGRATILLEPGAEGHLEVVMVPDDSSPSGALAIP
jgi:uncharacterized GH25 family protein